MWDASTIKLVLPGMSDAEDLEQLSRLAGEVRVKFSNRTTGEGISSETESSTLERIWLASQIRALPVGHALLFQRRLKPIEIVAKPYWERAKGWV